MKRPVFQIFFVRSYSEYEFHSAYNNDQSLGSFIPCVDINLLKFANTYD